MKNEKSTVHLANWFVNIFLLLIVSGCATPSETTKIMDEEGIFLIYRRQSQIGEETYSNPKT